MNSTNDIRDVRGPVEIPNPWLWVIWGLAILAAVALVFWFWRWWKRRAATQEITPPLSPQDRAREQLRAALDLVDQPKPFCIQVSDAVRRYLEERFEFHAPERTTEEFCAELKASDLLTPDQKETLGEFLTNCDLVKFAKYEPGRVELHALHAAALRLVEETEPEPVTEESKP